MNTLLYLIPVVDDTAEEVTLIIEVLRTHLDNAQNTDDDDDDDIGEVVENDGIKSEFWGRIYNYRMNSYDMYQHTWKEATTTTTTTTTTSAATAPKQQQQQQAETNDSYHNTTQNNSNTNSNNDDNKDNNLQL